MVGFLLRYKWRFLALLLLIALPVFYLFFQGGKSRTPISSSATKLVERGSITAEVAATGTINPVNMVDISSKISGLIKEVKVSENEAVAVGQILLTLDDSHLQSQVQQARDRLAEAASTYERSEILRRAGAMSDQQFAADRLSYQLAQTSYNDALSQLADTVIKAPISGTVIGKPIPAGQAVAPGISTPMVLMTVADMSKMQIQAQVDESDIGKVKTGQKVTFTVDAYPGKVFTGVVANVSQKATVQQNVVYYSVLVDIDDPSGLLRPTMTARVTITVGVNEQALLVPLSALKTVNGQTTVTVLRGGKSEAVAVTTGLASDTQIEITSGLNDNDQVVLPQAKSQTGPTSSGGPQGAGGMNMLRGLGR